MSRFYITTTLPYVNGKPHIGFALEAVQADVVARFHAALGEDVVFNVGTDEHGTKIWEKAKEEGVTPQEFCDRMSEHFRNLKSLLDISYTNFIRTTDDYHVKAAQEFWKLCEERGDIYKKNYRAKYCVGCELEKTDSDLVNGKCPEHPNREVEIVEEENYFFRFSNYQTELLKLYREQSKFVIPEKRLNEIAAFVERGLQDFSISRLASKMPWGIPVPGDESHVMYVWFDALVNYISTIGWNIDKEQFENFWPGVQIAGKDNLRQQSAMWQAMLLSAGLAPSRQILIHGHITCDGQKMSKSLGNVVSPEEMIGKFGKDGTRYLLLSAAAFGEDIDLSWERMTEKYNADLANGLGNLVSRVLKLGERMEDGKWKMKEFAGFPEEFSTLLEQYRLSEGLEYIWNIVRASNKYIEENKPWELAKTNPEKFETVMRKLLDDLAHIASLLAPFLPETSEKIQAMLSNRKSEILFQRI
ncbi:MAG: methionine--tRNA ligase [Candidatus Moraniibacteriota bacterium]|nr:MAG: methionine--tRNA ligase [Candidatus Moranbacteria bacterium]